MNNRTRTLAFQSALAPWIETFIAENVGFGRIAHHCFGRARNTWAVAA